MEFPRNKQQRDLGVELQSLSLVFEVLAMAHYGPIYL